MKTSGLCIWESTKRNSCKLFASVNARSLDFPVLLVPRAGVVSHLRSSPAPCATVFNHSQSTDCTISIFRIAIESAMRAGEILITQETFHQASADAEMSASGLRHLSESLGRIETLARLARQSLQNGETRDCSKYQLRLSFAISRYFLLSSSMPEEREG